MFQRSTIQLELFKTCSWNVRKYENVSWEWKRKREREGERDSENGIEKGIFLTKKKQLERERERLTFLLKSDLIFPSNNLDKCSHDHRVTFFPCNLVIFWKIWNFFDRQFRLKVLDRSGCNHRLKVELNHGGALQHCGDPANYGFAWMQHENADCDLVL